MTRRIAPKQRRTNPKSRLAPSLDERLHCPPVVFNMSELLGRAREWGVSTQEAKVRALAEARLKLLGAATPGDIPDDPRALHLHHLRDIAREDAEGLIK